MDCGINGGCDCEPEWSPVCVSLEDGQIITFPNTCFALCEGYTEADFVDCGNNGGCDCEPEWAPVCVSLEDGQIITFPNTCIALCEGYTEADFVDCGGGCDCFQVYDPVCAVDPNTGETITFVNACYALCEGYTADQLTECGEWNECWVDITFDFADPANSLTLTFSAFAFGDDVTDYLWDFAMEPLYRG
ncbi:MAG: hypothetical protein R2795_12255 [Saprospiraceae bacterium]